MARHRPDRRRVKIHHPYTVDEVARLLDVAKGTVRRWLKSGLPAVDSHRPTLIRGRELHAFLAAKAKPKHPCPPGHCFCVKCKVAREPGGGMAEFVVLSPTSGNLRAICPICGTWMHRRTSTAQLSQLRAKIEVAVVERMPSLKEMACPSTNDHSKAAT
jgi:excisionase family DNA binding protein